MYSYLDRADSKYREGTKERQYCRGGDQLCFGGRGVHCYPMQTTLELYANEFLDVVSGQVFEIPMISRKGGLLEEQHQTSAENELASDSISRRHKNSSFSEAEQTRKENNDVERSNSNDTSHVVGLLSELLDQHLPTRQLSLLQVGVCFGSSLLGLLDFFQKIQIEATVTIDARAPTTIMVL